MRLVIALLLTALAPAAAAAPAVFVKESEVVRQEPPPHDGKGMSTAYRISDAAPGRSMEFRKRVLHRGASIGLHVLGHDEVYYVVSGTGDVTADGVTRRLGAGDAAYLYKGSNVGIAQAGGADLAIIVAYPVTPAP